jgi:hypothetical protein
MVSEFYFDNILTLAIHFPPIISTNNHNPVVRGSCVREKPLVVMYLRIVLVPTKIVKDFAPWR